MASNVRVTDHSAPAIMLIEAMARESKDDDILAKFPTMPPLKLEYVNVKLTINGVEVDFVQTAREMWNRLAASHDEDVLAKAKELVGRGRLDKLSDILSRFEWELENEVEQLFKKDR